MNQEQLHYRVTGDAKGFKGAINQSQKSLNGFQNQIKGVAGSLKVMMSGALIAAGYQSVRLAKDFSKSMTQIKALVGVAGEEVDAMGKTARVMAVETGKSANEAAEALFFITSAGLRGSDAMDVLEASLKAAAVGLGETKQVADLATSALNAYGTENLSALEATDVLTASVREGKLEASELAASMGRVLPVASNMGVQFHEVGAAFAAMSRTGTNAAEASTSLNAILSGLLKPTEDAERALSEMGLSSKGLKEQIKEKGLLSVLKTLKTEFDKNGDAAARVFPNLRALRGVLDLTGTGAETNAQIFDALAESVGATETAFNDTKSASFDFEKELARLNETLLSVGEKILPVVNHLFKKFNDMLTGTTYFTEQYNKTLDDFSKIAEKYKDKQEDNNDALEDTSEEVEEVNEIYQAYLKTIQELQNAEKILGDEFDLTEESIKETQKSLIELLNAGEGNTKAFRDLTIQLKELETIQRNLQSLEAINLAEQMGLDADSEFSDVIDFSELEKELEDVKTFRDNLNEINEKANADLSQSVSSMFEEQNQKRLQQFQSFQQQVQQVAGMMQQHLVGLSDQFIASLGLANEGIQGLVQSMLKVLMQLAIQSIINAAVQKALSKAQVATQFSTAQAGAISSATNTAAMIPGGFFALPGMIAAATSMVGGAFAGLTAFADGGIVTRPVMGLVGEAGAEAIIPLNKLPQLMQASQGTQKGQFTLRGQDLVLALERAGDFRTRITG